VPPAYHQPIVTPTNQLPQSLGQWWRLFHDPQLDSLIGQAALANHDVRLAQARVQEARAQAGVTRSALLPSVNANGEYSRQRLSQNTPDGFLARAPGQPFEQNFFDAGFDMNWELDVFGGNRRALQAAQADLGATEEARRGVLITVLGDVGLNYLDLRGLQKGGRAPPGAGAIGGSQPPGSGTGRPTVSERVGGFPECPGGATLIAAGPG
jgi:outer membrane protein TolC